MSYKLILHAFRSNLDIFSYASNSFMEAARIKAQKKAKSILDNIGLNKMDSDGCRLRPDGKVFKMPFEMASFTGEEIPIGEMVSKFWNAIGICTTIKQLETNLSISILG